MTQVSVDQAAGASGVQIVLSFYFLRDGSAKDDNKFIKIVKMRCVFCVGIVFDCERFLIQNCFLKGDGHYMT